MLDIHNGLIQGVLDTRHEHLVCEQRMHHLATEARFARGDERKVRRRRRVLARLRAIPAAR